MGSRRAGRAIWIGFAASAAALALTTAPASAASTFTVDTAGDTNLTACTAAANDCSLRGAINDVNAGAGGDTIAFNIAAGGVQTITLTSDLPTITKAVTIDGSTEPGSVANTSQTGPINAAPAVAIDGDNHMTLVLGGGSSTVRGLVIYDAGDAAVTSRRTATTASLATSSGQVRQVASR